VKSSYKLGEALKKSAKKPVKKTLKKKAPAKPRKTTAKKAKAAPKVPLPFPLSLP